MRVRAFSDMSNNFVVLWGLIILPKLLYPVSTFMGRHRITWGCFQTVQRVTCSFQLAVFQNMFPSFPPKYFYDALSVYPLPLRSDIFSSLPHVFSVKRKRVTSARNKWGIDLDMCIGDHHVNPYPANVENMVSF